MVLGSKGYQCPKTEYVSLHKSKGKANGNQQVQISYSWLHQSQKVSLVRQTAILNKTILYRL